MSGLKNRSPALDQDRVTWDGDERAMLARLVAVGQGAARRLTHARILLLADTAAGPERADTDIVAALGTGVRTVDRVGPRRVTEGLQAAPTPGPSRLGRPRSRSRGTSSGPGSGGRAATRPRGAAAGPCRCWPTS